MSTEDQLQHIIEGLEAIMRRLDMLQQRLEILMQPPMMATGALEPTTTGVDANLAYVSGMFKRRDGHGLYDTPADPAKVKATPNAPVDPYLKPDRPAIDK